MLRLMPGRYRLKLEEWHRYAGWKKPATFFRGALTLSLAAAVLAALTGNMLLAPLAFAGVFALFHGMLLLAVEKRTAFAERVLPDALQLMAANSRAGYIPSQAFLMSARDEFGPLSEAIRTAGKELVTGQNMEEALGTVTRSIHSDALEHTMQMIAEGIKSGGNFSSLLEETANDIRRTQILKKEMKANVMMYVIFIFFAGCLGGPILYSLSAFLITTISSIGANTNVPAVAMKTPFLKLGTVSVPMEFLQVFSLVAISITTIFSGLIIAMISTGRGRTGIKYMPIFFAIAMIVYFASGIMIQSMFGSMIPHA